MNLLGTYILTTSAGVSVGIAGNPKRVYFVTNISDGTATVTKLYNGTTADTANFVLQVDGVISKGASNFIHSDMGIRFDKGLYVAGDAHTVGGCIVYEEEF